MQACRGFVRGRSASRFGWVCLVLAVALAGAVVAMPAGVATASKVPARFARSLRLAPFVHMSPRTELGLSRAPAGLRAAVLRTLGARAVGEGWSQQQKLIAKHGAARDFFGGSVAISGSTAVVGAFGENGFTGAAYVFVRSGTTWTEQAKLTASNGATGDQFGTSVAIYKATVVIGAPFKNSDTGAAYVFVRSGTKWSQQAKLADPHGVKNDDFGFSVAISGSTLVVAAPGENSGKGAAYVFVRSGTKWSQQAKLADPHGVKNDDFGFSAWISGSSVVVGAFGENSGKGAAYVFVRSGTSWSKQAKLTASDAGADDYFGYSVTISGSTAVIGAIGNNSDAGAAYVFVRSGTKWSQQAKLTASDGAAGDQFGNMVAISRSAVVVGAPNENSDMGAAYVFVRSGTKWSQQAKLTASDGAADDEFSDFAVAISGSTTVVGAPYKNSDTGAAYVFVHG